MRFDKTINKIEKIPDYTLPVRLKMFPPTFDPIDPGIELSVAEYRLSDGELVFRREARSYGPILSQNRELVEIHWSEYLGDVFKEKHNHWLEVSSETINLRMREIRSSDGQGFIEEVDVGFPAKVTLGDEIRGTDLYFGRTREAGEGFLCRVDETVKLSMGEESFECLKMVTVLDSAPDQVFDTFIEIAGGSIILAGLRKQDLSACGDSLPWETIFLVSYK